MWKSSQFRLFVLVFGLLFVANLLVMNDFATLWSSAESAMIFGALQGEQAFFLPLAFHKLLVGDLSFQPFLSRLPGAIFILLSLWVFYRIGRPIFGQNTSTLSLLAWGTTLIIPNIGKFATADSWLFFAQLLSWMSIIRFLKEPKEGWRILALSSLLLSLLLSPVSTILFFSIGSFGLYRFHPNGSRLLLIHPWIVLVAGGISLYSLGLWHWQHPSYIFGWLGMPFHHFLLIIFLALLPVFGFFIAGLRDLVFKFKKKEELAIILSAWIFAGLAAQSLLLLAGIGILVAKQAENYFLKGYPHKNWIRGGAVLHLVFAFCSITLLILSSFSMFRGTGFRSALAMGGVYWMLSFIAVIGLYGLRKRMIWGGTFLSGLMLSLFFWIQFYPLLESKRNWLENLETQAGKLDLSTESNLYIYQLPRKEQQKVQLYIEPSFRKVDFIETEEELLEFYINSRGNGFLIPEAEMPEFGQIRDSVHLEGWTDRARKLNFLLIKN